MPGSPSAEHPSSEILIHFARGLASAEERVSIDTHLDHCGTCRRVVSSELLSLSRGTSQRFGRVRGFLQELFRTGPLFSVDAVTEEERAILQRRLAMLVGIAAAVCALGQMLSVCISLYFFPEKAIFAQPFQQVSLGRIVPLLLLWWVLRHPSVRLEARWLRFIDLTTIVVFSAFLALNEMVNSPNYAGSLAAVLTVSQALMGRAVVVPSSGRRTALVCVLAAFASLVVQGIMAARTSAPNLPVILAVAALWLSVSTVVATVASKIIFGLRGEAARLRVAGQYVLHEKLGEGATGVVYRATHHMLRRPAAIKLLLPGRVGKTNLEAFEREVRATARLRHPNTIAIFDYGRTGDGALYYAMEYVEGCDLQRLVETAGPLAPGRVAHLLAQILASLAEAHAQKLVHRDIKPANVMVLGRAAPDLVKVVDFGLVRDFSHWSDDQPVETKLIGTPAYLAPELVVGGDAATPASDLYAVAAVGYFLLTGTTVFQARTVRAMLELHAREVPEHPERRHGRPLPEDLSALLLSGLAKDPARRPHCTEFRERLRQCQLEEWTDAQAAAWWEHHARVSRSSAPSPAAATLAEVSRTLVAKA
jgi:serine/threonine-protein kinase